MSTDNNNKKAATEFFDPVKFGRILREKRRVAGFSNTRKLSQSVKEKTGVFVDPDTLLKYERGEREPDITKFTALLVTIFGDEWRDEMPEIIIESMPDGGRAVVQIGASLRAKLREMAHMEQAINIKTIAAVSSSLSIPYDEAETLCSNSEIQNILKDANIPFYPSMLDREDNTKPARCGVWNSFEVRRD